MAARAPNRRPEYGPPQLGNLRRSSGGADWAVVVARVRVSEKPIKRSLGAAAAGDEREIRPQAREVAPPPVLHRDDRVAHELDVVAPCGPVGSLGEGAMTPSRPQPSTASAPADRGLGKRAIAGARPPVGDEPIDLVQVDQFRHHVAHEALVEPSGRARDEHVVGRGVGAERRERRAAAVGSQHRRQRAEFAAWPALNPVGVGLHHLAGRDVRSEAGDNTQPRRPCGPGELAEEVAIGDDQRSLMTRHAGRVRRDRAGGADDQTVGMRVLPDPDPLLDVGVVRLLLGKVDLDPPLGRHVPSGRTSVVGPNGGHRAPDEPEPVDRRHRPGRAHRGSTSGQPGECPDFVHSHPQRAPSIAPAETGFTNVSHPSWRVKGQYAH